MKSKGIELMNYSNKAGIAVLCAGTALFSTASNAAQDVTKPGFYATATASYSSDDNIYRQKDAAVSDTILTVSPDLLFIKNFGKHSFTAEYLGDYATYGSKSSEDFTDHVVSVDGLFDLTPGFNANVQAGYNLGHEPRADSGAGAAGSKVNKWTENTVFAGLSFGRDTSKGQVEVDYSTNSIAYTNNAQETRDRKGNTFATRAFYRLAKTKVFVEVKQNAIDYSTDTRDSTETFYHAGVRWDITYKTTGEFKIGSFEKKFDSSARAEATGTSYEGNLLWSPKDYSRVTFGLSKSPQESLTAADYYTSSVVSVGWDHNFNSKLAVNLGDTTDEYNDAHTEKSSTSTIGVNYEFRRSLDFGLNFTKSLRKSNDDDSVNYTDNLVLLTAKWSSAR